MILRPARWAGGAGAVRFGWAARARCYTGHVFSRRTLPEVTVDAVPIDAYLLDVREPDEWARRSRAAAPSTCR